MKSPAPLRVEVLIIAGNRRECEELRNIFGHTNWILHCVTDLAGAKAFWGSRPVPIVVCDAELSDGTWVDVIDAGAVLAEPPEVLVCGPAMNATLGMRVFEAGGFDILSTPFDRDQVLRSISLAFRKWQDVRNGRIPCARSRTRRCAGSAA